MIALNLMVMGVNERFDRVQHIHPVVPLDDGLVRKSLRLLESCIEREVMSNRILPAILVLHAAVEQVPGGGGDDDSGDDKS